MVRKLLGSPKGFFLRLPSSDTFSFIAPQIIPDFVDRFKFFLEFAIFLEFPFLCLMLFLVLSLLNYFMCLVHGLISPFKISLPKTWSPWLMCPVLTGCQEMAHSLLMFYSPLQEQLLPSWSDLVHQSPSLTSSVWHRRAYKEFSKCHTFQRTRYLRGVQMDMSPGPSLCVFLLH